MTFSSIRYALGALAFGVTGLAASTAGAQEDNPCGGVDFTTIAVADCHFETSGGCTANCEPVSFTASCNGECNVEVDASCSGGCTGGCEADCEVEPGSFSCEANCSANCEASASADCEGEASDEGAKADCEAYFEAECSGQCEGSCEATPPSASCEAKCEASCDAECHVEANASCSIDCQAELSGGCEVQCEEPGGALFCDGQFINAADIPACVAYLVSNFEIELEYSVSVEGSIESSGCTATPGSPQQNQATGILVAMAGLGFAAARRRRRS